MKKFFIVTLFLIVFNLAAQEKYSSPLDIPIVLSANFGELRPNHFHSGIDFKTQGVINKPVYSIADGYISRISVSPYGYGLALYIRHPSTGQESVYGHLNKFIPQIAEYVRGKQYEQKKYRVDLRLDETIFPVSKGDLVAYSGNTGSSGGPHLHFEIRDSETEHALDVIPFYKEYIKDTKEPRVRGIAIYPSEGYGVLNGVSSVFRQNITKSKNGEYSPINQKLYVWGKIGFGLYANDYMNSTNNIYGVKSIKLYCNGDELFSYNIESVDFGQTKMINSLVDYDHWRRNKTFYVKSYLDKGNKLDFLKVKNNGYIEVDEEKEYVMCYELEDVHSNKSFYSFNLTGKRQDIPQHRSCGLYMAWDQNNYYVNSDFTLIVPPYALYDDLCFTLDKKTSKEYLSQVYQVNDRHVPLSKDVFMKLKLTQDTLKNKRQYGIVSLDGKKLHWIGGEYCDGFLTARINRLGDTYAILSDTVVPVITPIQSNRWSSDKSIRIKATDNLSGIAEYYGTIDGEFALFEHDMKSSVYIYRFDPLRLTKGKHKLEFTVTDAAGNRSIYNCEFEY